MSAVWCNSPAILLHPPTTDRPTRVPLVARPLESRPASLATCRVRPVPHPGVLTNQRMYVFRRRDRASPSTSSNVRGTRSGATEALTRHKHCSTLEKVCSPSVFVGQCRCLARCRLASVSSQTPTAPQSSAVSTAKVTSQRADGACWSRGRRHPVWRSQRPVRT